jgi:hypothetical protein
MNLHHEVAVAEALSVSVATVVNPPPAGHPHHGPTVHVEAICARGHVNLFYVELA